MREKIREILLTNYAEHEDCHDCEIDAEFVTAQILAAIIEEVENALYDIIAIKLGPDDWDEVVDTIRRLKEQG